MSETPRSTELRKKKEEILALSPKDLAAYVDELDQAGEMDAFLAIAEKDDVLVAQISYWEKWFSKEQRKKIDEMATRLRENEEISALPLGLEKRFTPKQLEVILQNLGAIQLTFGCSKGCRLCGVDAIPGVREHIPFSQLESLFSQFGQSIKKGKPFLYYASEPSDYKDGEQSYPDVHQLAKMKAGYSPSIRSNESRDEEWLGFINKIKGGEPSGEVRLSVFGKTVDTVKQIRDRYKNLSFVGEARIHIIGAGVSSEAETERRKLFSGSGIGCFNGALLTPRGLYNIIKMPIVSKKYPQGMIVIPFRGFGDQKIQIGERIEDVMARFVVCKTHKDDEHSYLNYASLNILPVMNENGIGIGLILNSDQRVVGTFVPKLTERINQQVSLWVSSHKGQRVFGMIQGMIKLEIEKHIRESEGGNMKMDDLIVLRKKEIEIWAELEKMAAKKGMGNAKENLIKILAALKGIESGESKLFQCSKKDGKMVLRCPKYKLSTGNSLDFYYPGTQLEVIQYYDWVCELSEEEVRKLGIEPNERSDEPQVSINQARDLVGDKSKFIFRTSHTRIKIGACDVGE